MSARIIQYRKDFLLLGGLLLIAVFPFLNILIRSDRLIYSSDINYFFPHEIINRLLLSDSEFPLWNPYFGAGSPQMANIQAGFLYPPTFLLRGLPVVQMFNWDAVLHLFFAGAGIYLLLRHWQVRRTAAFTGAIIFMFSGAILPRIMIGHVSVVRSIAWSGWLLLAYDRLLQNYRWGDLLLTVWFTLLVILGGHPQMGVLVLLIPITYFLFVMLPKAVREKERKQIGLLLAYSLFVALFSIGLFSVQLFSYLDWLGQTSRGQGEAINTLSLMTDYSLNLEYLVTPIMPLLWFSPAIQKTITLTGFSHFWEASPFITVTGLLLLIIGLGSAYKNQDLRNCRLISYLLGLAIIGLLMSMGKQNPLYEVLHTYYPYFRAPGRFLIWWAFALALLVGFVLDGLPTAWATYHQQLKRGKQTAVSLLILSLILWSIFTLWGPTILNTLETLGTFPPQFSTIARESVPQSLGLLAVTSAAIFLLFWLGQTGRLNRRQWELCLLLLILVESFAFSKLLIKPFPVRKLYQDDNPLAQLVIDPGEIRIDGYRSPPNYLTPTLIHILNGEEYFALERLMKERREHAKYLFSAGFIPTKEPLEDANYTLIQNVNNVYLYEHVKNLPRLYAATSVLPVKSDDEAFAFVLSEQFNPTQQAAVTLYDGEIPPNLPAEFDDTATFTGKYINYANNSIKAEVTTDRPVLIIFSEIYYPGWVATVNEEPVPIYRSNYAFRGLSLDTPGTYQIEMQFRPKIFYHGLAVTGITAVIILIFSFALLLLGWPKKKNSPHV